MKVPYRTICAKSCVPPWYDKEHPTFADALALVRGELWAREDLRGSPSGTDTVEIPRALMQRLTDAVCYAA